MVTPTNHIIAGPIYIALSPLLALWRFLQHLSAKYRRKPKKSYDFSAGPLAGTASYYGIDPALVNVLRS